MSEQWEIITIDGPSGVGKSTISKKVAEATGFTYLDTGAMYRGVGFFLTSRSINFDNEAAVESSLGQLDLQLVPPVEDGGDVGVIVNGRNVSVEIRSPEIAMVASRVSALAIVREKLTEMQRQLGVAGKIVAEGRDMGTVVFPDAMFKFFLDAHPEVRARRRVEQLRQQGCPAEFEEILSLTLERDKNDSEREIAPLKVAEDALLIDTTKMSTAEVVTKVLAVILR